jgi:hypothetical protein
MGGTFVAGRDGMDAMRTVEAFKASERPTTVAQRREAVAGALDRRARDARRNKKGREVELAYHVIADLIDAQRLTGTAAERSAAIAEILDEYVEEYPL